MNTSNTPPRHVASGYFQSSHSPPFTPPSHLNLNPNANPSSSMFPSPSSSVSMPFYSAPAQPSHPPSPYLAMQQPSTPSLFVQAPAFVAPFGGTSSGSDQAQSSFQQQFVSPSLNNHDAIRATLASPLSLQQPPTSNASYWPSSHPALPIGPHAATQPDYDANERDNEMALDDVMMDSSSTITTDSSRTAGAAPVAVHNGDGSRATQRQVMRQQAFKSTSVSSADIAQWRRREDALKRARQQRIDLHSRLRHIASPDRASSRPNLNSSPNLRHPSLSLQPTSLFAQQSSFSTAMPIVTSEDKQSSMDLDSSTVTDELLGNLDYAVYVEHMAELEAELARENELVRYYTELAQAEMYAMEEDWQAKQAYEQQELQLIQLLSEHDFAADDDWKPNFR